MDFIDIFQHWSRSMGIAECGCVCVWGGEVGGGRGVGLEGLLHKYSGKEIKHSRLPSTFMHVQIIGSNSKTSVFQQQNHL